MAIIYQGFLGFFGGYKIDSITELVASKHKTVTDTQCRCRVVKNDSEPI
jgi:hypothetical protein